VERPFGYVEKNLLNARTFRTPQHLNEVASWWLEHRADVRPHGTLKERPIDRFVKEAPHLLPLPLKPYDTAEVGYRVVSTAGFVVWGVTPYSVPYDYILDVVVVRVTQDEVYIYDSQINQIVCHEKAPADHRDPVIAPVHRPKKRNRYDLDTLVARLGELDETGALFAAGVLKRPSYRGRHLSQVLGLLERYSADDLVDALKRAVRYRAFDGSVVERILQASATPRILPDTTKQMAQRLRTALQPTTPRPIDHYACALKGLDDEDDEKEE